MVWCIGAGFEVNDDLLARTDVWYFALGYGHLDSHFLQGCYFKQGLAARHRRTLCLIEIADRYHAVDGALDVEVSLSLFEQPHFQLRAIDFELCDLRSGELVIRKRRVTLFHRTVSLSGDAG